MIRVVCFEVIQDFAENCSSRLARLGRLRSIGGDSVLWAKDIGPLIEQLALEHDSIEEYREATHLPGYLDYINPTGWFFLYLFYYSQKLF